jgi:hypothetical protein
MLMGVNDEAFEVGAIDQGVFFLSAAVYHRASKFKFQAIGVYGPADHTRSAQFLVELETKVQNSPMPVVVFGDFNLIRGAQDKNNANINWPRVNAFNDSIARMALREVARVGARFTWSNRQRNPVRCVLDRVLVSPEWEVQFPLLSLRAATCLGSDHNPLVLDSGSGSPTNSPRFFFETSWFHIPGFSDMVSQRWLDHAGQIRRCRGPIDWWQRQSSFIRQFIKGWGANLGKHARVAKANLLAKIQELDFVADSLGLDEDGWALRYHLEAQMMEMLSSEEEYWRQRGRQQWILQGDANTKFFHAFANGRKRKCAIHSLSSDHGVITGKEAIQEHIYSFYRNLMGAEEPKLIGIRSDLWPLEQRVSFQENAEMLRTFTSEELDFVLHETKTDTAPGPDGLPVLFYKKFWPLIKKEILEILNGFALGRVDIARLNFGILSLLPKVPGADNIKQYRPIALINVIFKLVSKAYACRVSPVAHRVISQSQTAFIKGRFIQDGPLALHEIIHELHSKKLPAVLLKLDFEKAYDRVNWQFLQEVLRAKGFDPALVHRFMQLVSGGQTAISINGEVGPYFRNKRGVR